MNVEPENELNVPTISLPNYFIGTAPAVPDSFELPDEFIQKHPPKISYRPEREPRCGDKEYYEIYRLQPNKPNVIYSINTILNRLIYCINRRNHLLHVALWPVYWTHQQLILSGNESLNWPPSKEIVEQAQPLCDITEYTEMVESAWPEIEKYNKDHDAWVEKFDEYKKVKYNEKLAERSAIQDKINQDKSLNRPWWKFW